VRQAVAGQKGETNCKTMKNRARILPLRARAATRKKSVLGKNKKQRKSVRQKSFAKTGFKFFVAVKTKASPKRRRRIEMRAMKINGANWYFTIRDRMWQGQALFSASFRR
jgi:hypothetical protein